MGKQSTIKQRNPYVVHAIRRHAGSHTRPYKSKRGELNREHTMDNEEGFGYAAEGVGLAVEGDGIAVEADGYAIEGWDLVSKEGWGLGTRND